MTLEAREFFWKFQFGMLVVANILIYVSVFISTPATPDNPATLVPPEYQAQTLFAFFFMGFYQLPTIGTLVIEGDVHVYWPFSTLLLLLIIEKGCQQWLKDKFSTSPETIRQFELLKNPSAPPADSDSRASKSSSDG